MKIYLAGASRELDLIRGYRDKLVAAGHVVTHDWVAVLGEFIAAARKESDLDYEEMRSFSGEDLYGVRRAEAFWLLVPEAPSIGCWVELGHAIHVAMMRKTTIVVSGNEKKSIFLAQGHQFFPTHDAALAWLSTARTKGT